MRIIDADAIQIPSTYVDMFENCRNCKLLDEEQVREIINDAPTIEPKRGEWIIPDDDESIIITGRCSACGWESHLLEDDVVGMPFCPNCGARMKGADDE